MAYFIMGLLLNLSYYLTFVVKRSCPFSSQHVVHGAMGCDQNSFKLEFQYHQLFSGFLVKGHLSRLSRLSANDKGDNKMISGRCTDLLAFTLIAEENL